MMQADPSLEQGLSAHAIRTQGLTKVFPGRHLSGGAVREVLAVDSVDLAIGRGEMYGLIGPDGAGKTTVSRLLTGLMVPTRGRATVLGHDTRDHGNGLKQRIGYMAQQFNLYGDLTVMENLRFFAKVYGVRRQEQRDRMPRLLAFAGLEAAADRLGRHLSGGMKKKLALACTLIHEPEVVFLDEPTLGVDPVSRREFWDLLALLRSESELAGSTLTIVVCTPYMDEAERCHRIGLLHQGRLMAQGAPRDIQRQVAGDLLELHPSDFVQAKALAPTLPGVLQVQTLGDRLRLFVDDASTRESGIREALRSRGIIVLKVSRAQPRLEEAFISLIRRYEE